MTKPFSPGRILLTCVAVLLASSVAVADKGGQGKGGGKPDKGASHGASKNKGGGPGNADSKGGGQAASKGKGPKKFESSDRSTIQSWYRDEYASSGNCPPGLAKKNNGCMPPGLANKQSGWDNDYYRPSYFGYRSIGDGRYYYNDGYLYRIGERNSVLGYIPLLGGANVDCATRISS